MSYAALYAPALAFAAQRQPVGEAHEHAVPVHQPLDDVAGGGEALGDVLVHDDDRAAGRQQPAAGLEDLDRA